MAGNASLFFLALLQVNSVEQTLILIVFLKGGGKGNKASGKETERKEGWAGKGDKGKHSRQSKPERWDTQVVSQRGCS